MEDFTSEQLDGIATAYGNMARSLNQFQAQHWSELTHEQQLDLNAYQNSLLNRAQDIQTRICRPAFTNADHMANQILEATDKARTTIQKMENLPVAMNVGAITVALAAYAARANARGIEIALRELKELIE
ncbi:hypothetical protein [Spirosoma pollinicola]|uniref:Uncharacterized protein n=1 Tax=Spirosoma pollinicola TaxID=2057025 RepID=A0A2K8YVW4_9BACT|nr:hypothetical protein [Spirosoma pollinicola]AUD01780.1 hypothetical protein CWM47_08070 [Spirosoma pollinicola]